MRSLHVRTWSWQMFNVNLGTGGFAIVLASIPHKFRGQHAIGTVFFIIDIVVFIVNVVMLSLRAIHFPHLFALSFKSHSEGVWTPVSAVALSTLLTNTMLYGIPYCGPWLLIVCEVWYWVYMFLALCLTLAYKRNFRTISRKLSEISPPDALEVYPLMFCGVVGATLATKLAERYARRAFTVAIFSYVVSGTPRPFGNVLIASGLGFFNGLLILSVYVAHDLMIKNTSSSVLPSHLISVGVPGFTAYTTINLGHAALTLWRENDIFAGAGEGGPDPQLAGQIFFCISIWFCLLLVGMGAWLLMGFSWNAFWSWTTNPRRPIFRRWHYTWWGWTFPLTGFVGSLGRLGSYLPSRAFSILNIILVCFMGLMWLFNIVGTIVIIWKGELPGGEETIEMTRRQSDSDDEGGIPS
ncbi:voltage-dependent anion channel [Kockovaella imperatae]|uniref:Voltage-dependent anion channel n=1 Tax=Kockovaella imperatae TaxID=4999 RepID=A0A1Y1UHL5_9TREE|nr:voltage-dependent anion channel [Kockovaella imperatae]ORX36964.1 voltage-dependent anion channel [Kockovaella imperatae]